MAFTRTPGRALRLTDRATLEFFEQETIARKAIERRSLTFRAPAAYDAGADLILPADNDANGVLTKLGNVLSWGIGGGGGITEEDLAEALLDYQLLSEKDQPDGYASLDGTTKVPAANLGTGSPTSLKFLDGSQVWRVLDDADIPATIARDSEVAAAITTHEGLSDPHTGYQKESEKDAASGYPSLDGSTLVPAAELGTGTPTSAKFLDGSRAWRVLVDADIPAVLTVDYISSPFVGVTASTGATTIDLATGQNFKVTLAASTTLTLSNPVDGARYLFYVKQDGTGSWTVTWPSAVKWRSSRAPVISPAASAFDVITLMYHGGDGIYLGEYAQKYG